MNGQDGDLVGVAETLLAPLGNYGGPTQTVALLPGSPAIGAGMAVSGITTDQRGEPLDAPDPDIGALRSQGFALTPIAGSTPQSSAIGAAFVHPLAVTVTADDQVEPVDGGIRHLRRAFCDKRRLGVSVRQLGRHRRRWGGHVRCARQRRWIVSSDCVGLGCISGHLQCNERQPDVRFPERQYSLRRCLPGCRPLSLPEAVLVADVDRSGTRRSLDPKVFHTPADDHPHGRRARALQRKSPRHTGPAAGVTVSGDGKSRVFESTVV